MSNDFEETIVPENLLPYVSAVENIRLRIPKEWGQWVSCSEGWYPILAKLDAELTKLDPNYEIHQVKEKFGGLCYYYTPSENVNEVTWAAMRELVSEAELLSEQTCEICGEPGSLRTSRGWYRTLCSECSKTKGYETE